MGLERSEFGLTGGKTLHELHDGEGRLYGHFQVQEDGTARVWVQTWVDEYRPTKDIFPGPISAMRAIYMGLV